MQTDSTIYQKAFSRYLRTGVSIDTQLRIGEQKAFDDFRTGAANLAKALVARHIEELKRKFVAHGRPFPDVAPLNMVALEREFVARYVATHTKLSIKSAPEKDRIAAYDFLQKWFAQKIDPIVQPHYGVGSFMWVSHSSKPCANCAGNDGQIFRWDEGIAPPGCGHCQCSAMPMFEPGEEADDADQPSDQELLSTSWRLNYNGKSDIKWMNRIQDRGWTKAKISNTIRYGKPSPAYDKINKTNNATNYELDGLSVVVNNETKEVIYISKSTHLP